MRSLLFQAVLMARRASLIGGCERRLDAAQVLGDASEGARKPKNPDHDGRGCVDRYQDGYSAEKNAL